MRGSSAYLRAVHITVAGTKHENRPRMLKTLCKGAVVTLKRIHQNQYDENATAVFCQKKQIGWIPRAANLAVMGLNVRRGKISEVGTDSEGNWTHLVIELRYALLTPLSKMVNTCGVVVPSILKQMHVQDLKVARWIAGLPHKEHHDAIMEWNQMQMAIPTEWDEAPKSSPKKEKKT